VRLSRTAAQGPGSLGSRSGAVRDTFARGDRRAAAGERTLAWTLATYRPARVQCSRQWPAAGGSDSTSDAQLEASQDWTRMARRARDRDSESAAA